MDYQRVQIEHFPAYAVSNLGEVFYQETGEVKNTYSNPTGVQFVSLYSPTAKRSCVKSVAVLVAEIFCPKPDDNYNTVVHIDGDRSNNAAYNLMWRPREFAIAYHKEMVRDSLLGYYGEFYCMDTGEKLNSIMEEARRHGCLPSAIARSIFYNDQLTPDERRNDARTHTIVWPHKMAYTSKH